MMNILQKFMIKTKELGLTGALNLAVRKVTGVKRCQEEVDTLYYLLNHYVDITALPPAKGSLRKLQLCDAVLLGIFDEICRREGWTYSLCGGTLLGAARHKGFIPWDDDLDVAMPREDYNKAMNKLREIFASYGEDSLTLYVANAGRLGVGYKHLQTGVWCDIFPLDIVTLPSESEKDKKIMAKNIRRYKKFYFSHKDKIAFDAMEDKRNSVIFPTGGGGI